MPDIIRYCVSFFIKDDNGNLCSHVSCFNNLADAITFVELGYNMNKDNEINFRLVSITCNW